MANVPPLRLSRSQLAQFLKDQEQIRAFENLFSVVEPLADGSSSSDFVELGSAQASANEALATIASVAHDAAVCCAVTQAKAQDALDRTATLEQEMPVAIAAAENKANQALALVSDLSATVDGLQMQPASQPRKRQRFGMFWDTTTQTAAAINTAYAVTYNSPSGDPYWSNVALLLHMDGANGSTTFIDSSIAPKTVTAGGNAQISTAQSRFGGSSAAFDGAGDALFVANSSAFNLANSDFTIEGWVRFNVAPAAGRYDAILTKRAIQTPEVPRWVQIYREGDSANVGKLMFNADANSDLPWDVLLLSTTTLNANVWYFFAVTRSGNTFRLFINGTQEASATSSITISVDSEPITIGGAGTIIDAPLNGNIDELRITTGVARYTSNFTPPAAPFPDGAYSQNLNQGVVLRSPSEVQVDTEGVYNFQFSVQIDKTSGGSANFWTWWRVNGVNVPASASQIQIQGNNHEIFGAANILLDLKAGDYVQLMWAVSDTTVQLQYFPASGPVPEIPSVILTVTGNIRSET
jgi:hypothetical protein